MRKLHCFFAHFEHFINLPFCAMVLQANKQIPENLSSCMRKGNDILPEAQLCGCLPKFGNFVCVVGFDELIIDDEKGMYRDIVRERGERESGHVRKPKARALRYCGRGEKLEAALGGKGRRPT